jgi:uncharacterized protein DUF3224
MPARIRRGAIAAVLTTLAASALAAMPAAGAPNVVTPAEGSFTVVSVVPTSARPTPGGTCVVTATATFAFDGTLAGSFDASFVFVRNGPCPPAPASETFAAHGTYSGSVMFGRTARTGKFDFAFAGTIDAAGNARGTLVVLRGTEGLRGLSGSLTLSGKAGVGGTYRGTLAI